MKPTPGSNRPDTTRDEPKLNEVEGDIALLCWICFLLGVLGAVMLLCLVRAVFDLTTAFH